MDVRMSFALLAALCAGCGVQPQNESTVRSTLVGVTVPAPRDAGIADGAMDVNLIDQTCYAYSECRTTAHGLGV
jgi:hypothetical protein